jgi:uncharacterized protein (DUF2236 family)
MMRSRTDLDAVSFHFPPGRSMARRVHGERVVGLLYGQRALLIGALDPLTYTGTVLASKAAGRPFSRLVHTAKLQESVFLGSREEADQALAAVRRLHERVEGRLPAAAGPHPAGTPYSALDPELMLWTLAVIADSGLAIYETMVRGLDEGEREALWRDYLRFGELFGMPREVAPATYPEFRSWWETRLASPDLRATPHALRLAPRIAFAPPVPTAARGALALQNLVIKGTLTPGVRRIFDIEWTAAHEAAFRAFALQHRLARHLLPRPVRRGRNDVFFDLVARSERVRGGGRFPDPPVRASRTAGPGDPPLAAGRGSHRNG